MPRCLAKIICAVAGHRFETVQMSNGYFIRCTRCQHYHAIVVLPPADAGLD